jgi:hypothetical protein
MAPRNEDKLIENFYKQTSFNQLVVLATLAPHLVPQV